MLAVYCNPSRRFRIGPVSPLISDNNCNGRESDQVTMAKELAGDRVAVSLHDLIIIVGLGKGISWFESKDMGHYPLLPDHVQHLQNQAARVQ